MRHGLLLPLLGVLLLAGCGASRPVNSGVCNCQRAVRVPDKEFRTFLVDKGFAEKTGWHKLKPTADGCALESLECYEQGIHSLEGIEMFPQLEQITCSDNPITELNLNALPHLKRLYGLNLPLHRINIDSCHHLQHIELSHTQLDTFCLASFPELEFFFCIFSPLRTIDLMPCPNLRQLYIRGTGIREVDLRSCHDFWALHALDAPLGRIVVTPEQYVSDLKVSVADTVQIIVK
ncbi:MAG: hypothetical protein IK058_04385 [Bacteroidales bacterium]|nr:hypothetical protein [Bacteroidales bacterium]